MRIQTLAQQTGVPAKTIRYYEAVGVMPPPRRGVNNYRVYTAGDSERLRLIASARALGLTLAEIAAILAARDQGSAPCARVLAALDGRLADLDRRLAAMVALRENLAQLRQAGAALPLDDVLGEHCVCYLIKTYRDSGQVVIAREENLHD